MQLFSRRPRREKNSNGRTPNRFRLLGSTSSHSPHRSGIEPLEQRRVLSVSPQLIRDINFDSDDSFAELNGQVYFAKEDSTNGVELWRTDGTPGGTSLFANLNPGSADSSPEQFVATSDLVFFVAEKPYSFYGDTRQVWVSDGTSAGTQMITDIQGGFFGGSNPQELTVVGDQVFFTAQTETDGRELWVTDGTAAGTSMVADLSPGTHYYFGDPNSSNFGELVDFNGTLVFTKLGQLWKSDGTAAGTEMIFASDSADNAHPRELTVVDDTLFFTADDGTNGRELWKTDGTAGGTVQVKDIRPGADGSLAGVLTAVGSTLYFQADDGVHGAELWKSDGSATGTILVSDILAGSGNSNPRELTNVGGSLYFVATDGSNGEELWTSDGTAVGTSLVADIVSGSVGSNPSQLTDVGGTLFFAADNGTDGEELWTSNGTAAGTQLVSDFVSGSDGATPRHLTAFDGQVLFIGVDSSGTRNLDVSDGTSTGTLQLTSLPIGDPPFSRPSEFVDAGGVVFFRADDGIHGDELWRTDGTEEGTVLVKDIRPGAEGSTPAFMVTVGNKVFFSANDGTFGNELWVSDGTEAGTIRLTDINPGAGTSNPRELVAYKGEVFFTTSSGGVYRTDGTVAGTVQFNVNSWINRLAVNDDYLFLGSSNGSLYVSDGTLAGTTQVVDSSGLVPRNPQISGQIPTDSNGTVYFSGKTDEHGTELWKTDGTAAGTQLVKDIHPGTYILDSVEHPYGSSPSNLTMVGDLLYFTANDGTTGKELWRSDGTEAGTYLVKDISPNDGSFDLGDLTVVGDQLFFRASTSAGHELWVSDGTSAGTTMVKDIWPGPGHGRPEEMVAVGDTLYFQAETPGEGVELWKSDGTASGTVLLADINPGVDDSESDQFRRELTLIKNTLFFAADDGTTGGEPWLIHLGSNTAPVASAGGPYNITLGQSLTLDASASFDPDGDEQLSFFWDLDGDGNYNDMAGEVGVLTWETLTALGFSESNPSLNVSVRVSDGIGGADTSSGVVLTLAEQPESFLDGPSGAVPYQPRTFTLSASGGDGGPFSYLIDWDGDGEFDEAVAAVSGLVEVTHIFEETGIFEIGLVASDSSNIGPVSTHTVTVEKFQLQADEAQPGITNLVYGGSASTDLLGFFGAPSFTVALEISSTGAEAGIYSFNGRAIAFGGGGDDLLVSLSVGDVEFHGGDGDDILVGNLGNDTLSGGNGADILLGRLGADVLLGGDGRDILFGGGGADYLHGGADEDLLVAGSSLFTEMAISGDLNPLYAMRAEWTSSRSYEERVANLFNGSGTATRANGDYFLTPGLTVFSDDEEDVLAGDENLDWFIYSLLGSSTPGDNLIDHEAGEELTDSPDA